MPPLPEPSVPPVPSLPPPPVPPPLPPQLAATPADTNRAPNPRSQSLLIESSPSRAPPRPESRAERTFIASLRGRRGTSCRVGRREEAETRTLVCERCTMRDRRARRVRGVRAGVCGLAALVVAAVIALGPASTGRPPATATTSTAWRSDAVRGPAREEDPRVGSARRPRTPASGPAPARSRMPSATRTRSACAPARCRATTSSTAEPSIPAAVRP